LGGKRVDAVAFTPDGKGLVTADGDQAVRLWDVKTGNEVRQLLAGQGQFDRLAISPDGKSLATSGRQQKLRLGDVDTGKEQPLPGMPAAGGQDFCFSPDGKWLATVAPGQPTVHLWDLAKRRQARQFRAEGGAAVLAFSWDSRLLACGRARVEAK